MLIANFGRRVIRIDGIVRRLLFRAEEIAKLGERRPDVQQAEAGDGAAGVIAHEQAAQRRIAAVVPSLRMRDPDSTRSDLREGI